jgi:hypothetical protein
LIDDTINFEQKYHLSRMKRQRYNVRYARHWYLNSREALTRIHPTAAWPNRDLKAFVSALLQMLLPNSTVTYPDTFNLDTDRLRALRAEIQDLMYENICCQILTRLVAKRSRAENVNEEAHMNLRGDLQKLIADGRFLSLPSGNISVELVRHALRLSGQNTEYDAELAEMAEEWLLRAHSNPDTQQQHAEELKAELLEDLFLYVERYLTISPWDIFNALVAPTISTQPVTIPSAMPGGSMALYRPSRRTDLLHRLSHIAVLHWRIWENLVYNNEDIEPTASMPMQTTATPGTLSRSPTPNVQTAAPVLSVQTTASPVTTASTTNDLDQPSECNPTTMPAFP